jgi:hypothetical protein
MKKKKPKSLGTKVSERRKSKLRHFHLQRVVDETGMSGTGRVAEGVQLPNGVAAMWWLVPEYGVSIYKSVKELHRIHKHGKRDTTRLVWDD